MQARTRARGAKAAATAARSVRPSSEEIDERILDVAAGVFAQLGYAQASLQSIADATGYSKTGLLHRFGSKEELRDAVRNRCLATLADAFERASGRKAGAERDRENVAAVVDLAMEHPGCVALMLSGVTNPRTDDTAWVHHEVRDLVDAAFGMDDATPLARRMRVVGSLGALTVGAALTEEFPPHEVRAELNATCCAALGI